jgi:hypothetical protein
MLTFCLSNISYASTFSSKDLVGRWQGCFLETTEDNTTRLMGSIRIIVSLPNYDISGGFGDWDYNKEYTTNGSTITGNGSITGGSLNITAKGEITGTINTETLTGGITGTINIINGWMDQGKKYFYVVTEKPGGQLSSGLFVKYDETVHSFSISDLEGIWFNNSLQSSLEAEEDDAEWVVNILSTNSNGSCSGTWYSTGTPDGAATSGTLSLDSHGAFTGTLNPGTTVDLFSGRMSTDKNTATNLANILGDDILSGVSLRAGGTGFVSQDLQGTWAVYLTEVYGGDMMYWLYGEITIDSSGKMLKGTWTAYPASGSSGTFTAGQINIADSGELSGTVTNNLGYTYAIRKGVLSLSKTHASFTMEYGTNGTGSHRQDTVFAIKKPNNNIVPAINLLIGE